MMDERSKGYLLTNTYPQAFTNLGRNDETVINSGSGQDYTWRGDAIRWRGAGMDNVPLHRIPPSYKGWIWCEDQTEHPTLGNVGYCTGAHYGNQKDNLEKSFQEWGAKESARNKGGW